MTVGESILKHRKELGMSQEELGQKLLVSRQTISQWETDQTVPTIDNLMRLKDVFGISADEILNGGTKAKTVKNKNSLDTVCGALAYAMGIEPPEHAAEKNWDLANYVDRILDGGKVDRVVMYNPDAVAQWIYEKYPQYFADIAEYTGIEISLATVVPSVTPVCFGTMYTGAQPAVHGIQRYEKPIITIDTLFDALIRAGKKPALITCGKCSLSQIYLGRDLDYYHFGDYNLINGVAPINAKAAEVILRDEHDFIVIYNGNYDARMHKTGPESSEALAELRANIQTFAWLNQLIQQNWQHHNTLVGFAMDHGCHEIDGNCGSHGLDMPEDLNIVHLYKCYPRSK